MPIQSKQQPPYYTNQSIIKIYHALLNQSGTDAPTPNILTNTLPVTWAYTSTGTFTGTTTTELIIEKTSIITGNGNIFIYTEVTGPNTLIITTRDNTFTLVNGALYQLPILIILYP